MDSTGTCHKATSNYDAKSDDHNMIIGSIALFLTLFAIVIALSECRHSRRSHRSSTAGDNRQANSAIELRRLGMLPFYVLNGEKEPSDKLLTMNPECGMADTSIETTRPAA